MIKYAITNYLIKIAIANDVIKYAITNYVIKYAITNDVIIKKINNNFVFPNTPPQLLLEVSCLLKFDQIQLRYSGYGQMSPGQMLPG